MKMASVFNFNIGVLGHVDSGKTSLAKALSTVASTAAFDKNPQSKERGITLDLGFSSFTVDLPAHLKDDKFDKLQYTLVDCPGHASLIKTIIGGAQIIDLMILVIDVTKGMQTQTAECLVIGEIICNKMLVVLNKIDQLPEPKRKAGIDKMTKRMIKTLEKTKFAGCHIIPVAASVQNGCSEKSHIGIDDLIDCLKDLTYVPQRNVEGPFIYSVDHCFSIKGQGTVMTGTVLEGKVSVNDNIEIPTLKLVKKVKSIQMYRKSTESAKQGDRAGVCVTQFDPKLLERGVVCSIGALPELHAAIAKISKIPYFSGPIETKSKFHITIGHTTVMAKVTIFSDELSPNNNNSSWILPQLKPNEKFNFDKEYKYQETLLASEKSKCEQWVLLEFEKPITCKLQSLALGSRFDSDINANKCRLSFHCRIVESITDKNYHQTTLQNLKIFKEKQKTGVADRMHDEYTIICKDLLKKETNIDTFSAMKVELSTGEKGRIEGTFGQSGKIKIRIPDGLGEKCKANLAGKGGKKSKSKKEMMANADDTPQEIVHVYLNFKRYIFDSKKRMLQT